MDAALITPDGTRRPGDAASVRQLLSAKSPFWLDLHGGKETAPFLREVFGFHPLAVEDAEQFGQRPKVDDYGDYVLLILYGAPATGHNGLVEVHCFYSEQYLVTVHHTPCPELEAMLDRLGQAPSSDTSLIMLLHGILDSLVDSFFPLLADFDDDIDDLEDSILVKPTQEQLGRLFTMKRSLISVRKVITPMRDAQATLVTGVNTLPGMTREAERYFRDVYDHLIRISDLLDSYRDLLSGALDTHLSTVSNRMNVVIKQLTIVATLFLPLTFLTGFFGQNFGFLVANIQGLAAFLVFGLGLEILAPVCLLLWIWHSGWLSGDSAAVPRGLPANGANGKRRRARLPQVRTT
ncbi:MAG TPA: magnesium transporter CorA family protein [Chloroflexota bacterium]|jgi:magnesium transporter